MDININMMVIQLRISRLSFMISAYICMVWRSIMEIASMKQNSLRTDRF